jgi:hypothetical protein
MPTLHIAKLRSGEHGEDAYTIVETVSLPRWDADPPWRSWAIPKGASKAPKR